MAAVTLRPLPGVNLRVEGDRAAVAHFSAEYAQPAGPSDATLADFAVSFVPRLADAQGVDHYKSVSWRARLDLVDGLPARLSIALRGRPRWFGLSLVQGYLVEPCLSLLAPANGEVLVPAAGIVVADGVDLLVGRSRTGKSSLSMRALAAGLPILGDDQVVVLADGSCLRFPRRLRVYDDLSATAPRAAARLPRRHRAGLVARRLARLASAGRVAPSMALPVEVLGAPMTGRLPLRRVVLLARVEGADGPRLADATAEHALARVAEVLTEQRSRLAATFGPSIRPALASSAQAEAAILAAAFASVPIVAIDLPSVMDAPTAVRSLAGLLGLP